MRSVPLLCMSMVGCVFLFVLASCGKDSPTSPPSPPPPPASEPSRIEITPSTATLNSIDQTVQLAAVVLDQNGSAIADASVTWTSGTVDVAMVSDQGLVTAVNNGSAVITAQSGSLSASASITVSQVPVRIVIEPKITDMGLIFEATVQDSSGQPVAGAEVTWSSSDESVATVSDQGLITPVGRGTAQITARSGDLSASTFVGIRNDPRALQVLAGLYRATDGPDWTQNTNWFSSERVEEWYGVTANSKGRVVKLNLFDNNLGSSIPMEMGQLTYLEELNLGSNRISGEIPAILGQLSNLLVMDLGNNNLSGEIPAELGRLEELEVLALDKNELIGELPAELGNLANLRELHLQENESLSGPLPDSFTNLELQTLNLGETELCVPASPEFQAWIEEIEDVTAATCPDPEIEAP